MTINDIMKCHNIKKNDAKTRKLIIDVIVECSKINNQFIGRRIGEIDLDVVYSGEFNIPKKLLVQD